MKNGGGLDANYEIALFYMYVLVYILFGHRKVYILVARIIGV